jgi:hypothetical protein
MIIEYQIKRFDLVKSFFYALQHSRRTQLIVFGMAFLFFVYYLLLRYSIHGSLVLNDFIFAILEGIGIILAFPVLSFLTAKTRKRTLIINPAGIETRIGNQAGKIPWENVDSVVATKDRIFITGKNANSFTIPSSAFTSADLRNQFIELASQYLKDTK